MRSIANQGTIPAVTVSRYKPNTGSRSRYSPRAERGVRAGYSIVPKHQSCGLSIEKLVISLYAKGMSISDIEEKIKEIYVIHLSTSAISMITNRVSQQIEWQNRPLESLYLIVWMDGIVFKVRENGKVINKTVYLCVGLNKEGLKEVLGMWVGKLELGYGV
jgi:transposase-like protein